MNFVDMLYGEQLKNVGFVQEFFKFFGIGFTKISGFTIL